MSNHKVDKKYYAAEIWSYTVCIGYLIQYLHHDPQLQAYTLFRESVISDGLQDNTLNGYARLFNATVGGYVSDEDDGVNPNEVLLMLSVILLELLVTATMAAAVNTNYDAIVSMRYHKLKCSSTILFRSFILLEIFCSLYFICYMVYILIGVIKKQYHIPFQHLRFVSSISQ